MSIFAIAAGIPDDIGAGYPLGPFFSSIAELVPARSRAARTRRSARRYALPQRPDEGKHLSQTSRSEEHTSELQSLMRISYAVFCLKKKKNSKIHNTYSTYYLAKMHLRIKTRDTRIKNPDIS